MLTVALAAVFCLLHAAGSFLHTGKAGPRDKKEESQADHSDCPEAVSLDVRHGADTVMPTLARRFRQYRFCLLRRVVVVKPLC
jgi:hypothetical protein